MFGSRSAMGQAALIQTNTGKSPPVGWKIAPALNTTSHCDCNCRRTMKAFGACDAEFWGSRHWASQARVQKTTKNIL